MELFCKVQSASQRFIPATTLVWKGSESLRSDPFQEVDVGDVANALMNTSTQFCHASLSQGERVLLNEANLVATAVAGSLAHLHAEAVAGCARGGERRKPPVRPKGTFRRHRWRKNSIGSSGAIGSDRRGGDWSCHVERLVSCLI